MALTKCKKCSKEVGTEAETCPKFGAKLKHGGNRMGCGLFLALIFIIGIFGSIFKAEASSTSSAPLTLPPPPALPAADQIPYQVVEQWSIPNGGYGRVIVIDPKFRNEQDMRKLAERLKRDTHQDRNAFITVFDDKVAASRRKAAIHDQLGKKELAHYDAHMIGSYIRNINTGYHVFQIMLKGIDGPTIEVHP